MSESDNREKGAPDRQTLETILAHAKEKKRKLESLDGTAEGLPQLPESPIAEITVPQTVLHLHDLQGEIRLRSAVRDLPRETIVAWQVFSYLNASQEAEAEDARGRSLAEQAFPFPAEYRDLQRLLDVIHKVAPFPLQSLEKVVPEAMGFLAYYMCTVKLDGTKATDYLYSNFQRLRKYFEVIAEELGLVLDIPDDRELMAVESRAVEILHQLVGEKARQMFDPEWNELVQDEKFYQYLRRWLNVFQGIMEAARDVHQTLPSQKEASKEQECTYHMKLFVPTEKPEFDDKGYEEALHSSPLPSTEIYKDLVRLNSYVNVSEQNLFELLTYLASEAPFSKGLLAVSELTEESFPEEVIKPRQAEQEASFKGIWITIDCSSLNTLGRTKAGRENALERLLKEKLIVFSEGRRSLSPRKVVIDPLGIRVDSIVLDVKKEQQ